MTGITNIRKITTFSEHKFFRKKNARNFGKTQKILEKRKKIWKNAKILEKISVQKHKKLDL